MSKAFKSGVGLLITVWMLLSTGCTYHQSESVRANSFKPYANRKIAGVEVEKFLCARVTVLVSCDPLSKPQFTNGAVRILPKSNLGCAVAIDPRGYYLTASHNLVYGANYLLVATSKTEWVTPSRIVWQGDYHHGQPDLAILHVPKRLEHTFAWAQAVRTDEAALAVGLSWSGEKFSGFGLLGGKIFGCRKPNGEPGESLVANDLPLQPGDSGGPLVDLEGDLIGINVQGTPPSVHWVLPRTMFPMVAERPKQIWLKETIEADVARQSAKAESRAP